MLFNNLNFAIPPRGGTAESEPAGLITNGTFDSDTGWTKEEGWTITGGKAVATGVDGTSIWQDVATETEGTYTITADLIVTSGTIALYSNDEGTSAYSESGTMTLTFPFIDVTDSISFTGTLFTGTIDNVTMVVA